MEDFIIREANKEDCDGIVDLMKELVLMEGNPSYFQVTPEVMKRDGFGEQKHFYCLVADLKHPQRGKRVLVGYLLYILRCHTWSSRLVVYMDDLYVVEQYRGQGIGSALLKTLNQKSSENGYIGIQFFKQKNNTAAVPFYQKFGALNTTEIEGYELWRIYKHNINKHSASIDVANVRIRHSVESDCEQTYKLFLDLVESEGHSPSYPLTDISKMRHCLFDEEKLFSCMVAETLSTEGETPVMVGYVFYLWQYHTWMTCEIMYVSDLYVLGGHRGQGIGTALMKTLIQVSNDRDCPCVQLFVQKTNRAASSFYKKLGAVNTTESQGYNIMEIGEDRIKINAGYC